MTSANEYLVGVGYVRVSTLTQVDGGGLDVQRDKIAAWCSFSDVPLERVHKDEGISGASMDNRPAFKDALRRALELGDRAVLIVYKLDRLGRNAIDVQETIAVLLDAKVRVVAVAEGIDSASQMGGAMLKLLVSLLATFAELEKEAIRGRLLDGRKRADVTNHVYTSEPAYGRRVLEPGSDVLVVDDAEQRTVSLVRALHDSGRSLRAIVAELDAQGIRPRRGAKWSLSVVHKLATGHRAKKKPKTDSRIARARAAIFDEPTKAA